ncbi:MAG: LysE family translocator [Denitrovibrio sp.]|mgnify:CR=1 FL=1|nr:MAG: LysE family translocator [Denitrovibrio sp.]
MSIESSIAFVLAMSLFVSSPGPGVMGCVAVAMRQSVSNSISFILGMIIGDIVYLSFAVFGLTAIATNFNSIFHILRVLGGFYLLYLAFKLWRSKPITEQTDNVPRKRNTFLSGLFITLSNPKVIIFYCGFLPNFMDLGKLTSNDLIIVCILVAFVITVVMGSYSFIAMRTGRAMSRRSGTLLNKSASTALAATGTYLLIKH